MDQIKKMTYFLEKTIDSPWNLFNISTVISSASALIERKQKIITKYLIQCSEIYLFFFFPNLIELLMIGY